jgi:hypothetical protein
MLLLWASTHETCLLNCLIEVPAEGFAAMQDGLSVVMAEVLETPRPRFVRPVTEEAWLRGCGAVWHALGVSKDIEQYGEHFGGF